MINKESKNLARLKRHGRARKNLSGSSVRPRLNVFRSLQNIYAQVIDDTTGNTLVSASTLDAEFKGMSISSGNIEAAKAVGQLVAKKALDKGIKAVVFDRGGYIYHGRVKALAEAAREAGLEF
ncbi:50S ribosomal protein L18 [Alkalicella caledoniensis]|uniref:Large ribosomal subunit protein uL18 n=1 Tax=Alkalicella caledoniensis TaxID=2731377 RepID=A0A7G9W7W3_ALKCA|nr:50S ribosomal protein L18 [Alkalicella caledoniensis]QNO14775.1 50S ribosomal protein L18 [Alkalicella caledoniensis]